VVVRAPELSRHANPLEDPPKGGWLLNR